MRLTATREAKSKLSDVLASYQFMLARLGKSQYDIAYDLFGEFSDLNFKLLVAANNYKVDIDHYPLDFTKDNEEPKQAHAVLPKSNVDATKFKLAQQIAGIPIIAEFNKPKQVRVCWQNRTNKKNISNSLIK